MKVSRRRFIVLGGLGATGLSLATVPKLIQWAQAGIDTPFPQPPDLKNESSQTGLVEFSLRASSSRIKLLGQEGLEAALMTYNGSFPGPTMRVKEGDRVRIQFRNDLKEPTNLHFHGLHISPTGQGDNVFRTVKSGETALYEFEIPSGSAGTYWYHPHHHGNANTQLFAGLSGAIVVDRSRKGIPELQNVPDYLIALKDLEIDAQGAISPLNPMDWMNGREGSRVMVNGVVKPTLTTDAGLVRLRLLNQCVGRYFNLKLEGHPMMVIATDGSFVGTPYSVESLLLAPGERYEVLVKVEQPGDVVLINQPYDRGMMGMGMMGGMDNDTMSGMQGMNQGSAQRTGEGTLMTLQFTGSKPIARMPSSINPIKALSPKDVVQTRTLNFTERMGKMASGMESQSSGMAGMMSFSFNGLAFDRDRVDIRTKLGTVELWNLVNNTDMDHPFHLHVNAFQVYARNGKPEPQPVWKDVVNVRSQETVQILVPFTDFIGKTVFHCHLLEHEELGMMGVVEIVA
jgi:FtsP/CotA-like multicopper oxidase with cupredoxin domain